MNNELHESVLFDEVMQAFHDVSISKFVDGTLGAGGHAEGILRAHPEIERFYGIDQDDRALGIAKARLEPFGGKFIPLRGNFRNIKSLVSDKELFDGILVDLGVSSMQFDEGHRGFSFRFDAPLDMRMDQTEELTAATIINEWEPKEIARIFWEYGEEKYTRRAVDQIVKERKLKPIETTFELVKCLDPIWPAYLRRKGIDPVTKVFQALRIAVNDELRSVEEFIPQALALLAPKGRLAIISFHSLEDRIVKRAFADAASDKVSTSGRAGVFLDKDPLVRLLTRKALEPTEAEIEKNRRSRSAKLRVVEKL